MADFIPQAESGYKKIVFAKEIDLVAGEKLTDDSELVEFSQRTVPTGKTANVKIAITVQISDVI